MCHLKAKINGFFSSLFGDATFEYFYLTFFMLDFEENRTGFCKMYYFSDFSPTVICVGVQSTETKITKSGEIKMMLVSQIKIQIFFFQISKSFYIQVRLQIEFFKGLYYLQLFAQSY